MDSFLASGSLPSELDENLALIWLTARDRVTDSPASTPWVSLSSTLYDSESLFIQSIQNTTSSGLDSEYEPFQGYLTRRSDVGPPAHQLELQVASTSQPSSRSIEQEILELRDENAALKARNTDLEMQNDKLRYSSIYLKL